jgi:hypothetical protein
MGVFLRACYNQQIDINQAKNLKEIIQILEDEITFQSKKLDYISKTNRDEKKMDFYCSVQTNLYTILNILKNKRGKDITELKRKFQYYFKLISIEDQEYFNKESLDLENYLKTFD